MTSVSWRCAACIRMVAANARAVPGQRERAEATDATRWVVVLVVGCAIASSGVAWVAGRGSEIGRLRGNQRFYFGKASRSPSEAPSTGVHNDTPGTTPLTRTAVATRGLPVPTAFATSLHVSTSSERACQPGLVPVTRGGLHGRLEHAGPGVNFTDKIGFRWFCSRLGAARTPTRVVSVVSLHRCTWT